MITIEIRSAEGGDHAKRLVHRQADIYRAFARRNEMACVTVQDGL
jgi:protein subunit release factor A